MRMMPVPWQSPTNLVTPQPQIVRAVPRLFLPAGAFGPPSLDATPIFTDTSAPAPAVRRAHPQIWRGPRDALGNPIFVDTSATAPPTSAPPVFDSGPAPAPASSSPRSPTSAPSSFTDFLTTPSWGGLPTWVYLAGGVGVAYLVIRKKGRR